MHLQTNLGVPHSTLDSWEVLLHLPYLSPAIRSKLDLSFSPPRGWRFLLHSKHLFLHSVADTASRCDLFSTAIITLCKKPWKGVNAVREASQAVKLQKTALFFVPFWRKAPGGVATALVTLRVTVRCAMDSQSHHFAQDMSAAFSLSMPPLRVSKWVTFCWKNSFQLPLTRDLSIERLSRYAEFWGGDGWRKV